MSKKFLVKDSKTDKYVAGPFSRKKAKRVYGMIVNHYGGKERYQLLRFDKVKDWDGIKRDPEGDVRDEEEITAEVLSHIPEPSKFEYRTGIFHNEQPIKDLFGKLGINDYEISKTEKGFYADYNDQQVVV